MCTEAGEVAGCFEAEAGVGAGYEDGFASEGYVRVWNCDPAVDEHGSKEIPAEVN